MGLTQRLGLLADVFQPDSSLNVGIGGAANSSYKLTVTGATLTTGAATFSSDVILSYGKALAFNSISNQYVTADSSFLYLGAGNTWRLKLDASTGAATFSSSVTAATESNFLGTSVNSRILVTASGVANTVLGFNNSGSTVNGVANNSAYIGCLQGYPLVFTINDTERMRITSAGNVGIGMTPISGVLNTNGNLRVYRPSASPDTYFETAVTDVTTTFTGYDPDGYMSFIWKSNANERMRITSGGIVQIGGTLGIGGRVQVFNDSNTGVNIMDSASSGKLMAFQNSNVVQIGSITTNGSSTAYNTTSDYRLKEDLKEIKGLEKISAIKVYDFKWKNSEYRTDGVIAHELAEVIPYAVNGEKDGEQMQMVDYSKIVPVLVKAIQELSAKVTALENK